MLGLEIFAAIFTLCSLLLLLIRPWKWPSMKLLPTAYLRSHELYDKLTQVLAENKGTILCKTSWYSNLDVLVTSDPANVQHVMNSKFSIYQRGSEFRKAFDFLGDAVFIKDLDEWKEGKKFTHGFYKETQFHESTPKIVHRTLEEGLIPVLDHMAEENLVLDFQNLFSRYMLDATCLMAAGFDLASLRVGFPVCPLLDAMDDMGEAVFWRNILPERVWKLQKWLGIGKEKKMTEACKVLNATLADFVSNKNENDKESEQAFDVLNFYREGTTTKHTDTAFLTANIMTLLFAGRDTSAALLTWFFHLISRNPSVEKKLLKELSRNSPPQQHLFSNPDEIAKLSYLHCALTESLRLFPAAPVIIRDPTQDDELPTGHRVGRSTKIILCSYAMGRTPAIWGDDCGEFKPERWMCGEGGVKHARSNAFLAFGSGPTACPGRDLAFTRMKAVAATILHNYDVEVLEGQIVRPSVSALLTIEHGLEARVCKRSWL